MKVAILSPVAWRTPPRQYGPWEQVASNVAEGLVDLGVDVTLFATGDSLTSGQLDYIVEQGYAENGSIDAKVNECLHISHLFERAGDFDIIHNHFDFLPLTYSRLITTPMITTIHGFSSPLIIPVYKKYNQNTSYVSISDANRHPDLHYLATVYNGINTQEFTYVEVPKDYLLFFGRIHPEKGAREAIEVARRCDKKLIIAGLIQDQEYFNTCIAPFIDNDKVVYAGNCNPIQRDKLLCNALALLHLISFEEPFGLSVVESMCCGTPVIAFNRGSMAELIEDKRTGFLVNTIEQAEAAVHGLSNLSRRACHQCTKEKFSKEKMAADYLSVYNEILNN
jgi:glycosyltransferase involved in cell wall biosynthesis